MQLGMIGLGRMGANLVWRLLRAGHDCVVYDLDPEAVKDLESEGATGAAALDGFSGRVSDSGEGRWTVLRRWKKAYPPRSSPPPSTNASLPRAKPSSPAGSSPPCVSNSAVTTRSRRAHEPG